MRERLPRRAWLFRCGSAALAASLALPSRQSAGQLIPGGKFCAACDGLGYVPLAKRTPYVWVEGQKLPKGAAAVPHQPCVVCEAGSPLAELALAEDKRLETATGPHLAWERDTGFSLTRVETRHAVIHCQLPAGESLKIGQAFERLHAELQKMLGSMRLSVTRPATYEIMALLEKPSYDHFRQIMEKRFTREQLGDNWALSRDAAAWDHSLLPFFYETRRTMLQRPHAHGVCFMGGRRQIQVASGYQAPIWLYEGFAELCEFLALRANLWRSVYNQNPGPRDGDWPIQLRQAAIGKNLRPWPEQFKRELRDWDAVDYLQTFGMTAYLFSQAPKKFLAYIRLLRERRPPEEALVAAYEKPVEELDAACLKWIVGGGL